MQVIPTSVPTSNDIEQIDSDVAAVLSDVLGSVREKRESQRANLRDKRGKGSPVYEAVRRSAGASASMGISNLPEEPAIPAFSATVSSNHAQESIESMRNGRASRPARKDLMDVYREEARERHAEQEARRTLEHLRSASSQPSTELGTEPARTPDSYAQPSLDIRRSPRLSDTMSVSISADVAHAASRTPARSPYSNLPYVPMGSLLSEMGEGATGDGAPTLNVVSGAVHIDLREPGNASPQSEPVQDDAAREGCGSLSHGELGSDEHEIWNLDTQFMQWLYCRCMSYMEKGLCTDAYIEFDGRVMSHRHALEVICGDALFAVRHQFSRDDAIVEEVSSREQRAARLWAEILPSMWCE